MWCHEVLEVLSDYLDGSLDPDAVRKVHAHLKSCDWCEQFGQQFADTVKALRARLHEPERLGGDIATRLQEYLKKGN
jgi:anti-sigma factor RsiW